MLPNISHEGLLPRLIQTEIGFPVFRNVFPLNGVRSSCQEVFFLLLWSFPVAFSLCHFAFFVPRSGGSLSRMRQKESLGSGGTPRKRGSYVGISPWPKGGEQKHSAGRNMLKDVISNSDKRTDMET